MRQLDKMLLAYIYRARGTKFPPLMIVSLPKSGSVYLQTALRRTLRVPMVKFDAGGTFDASLRYFPLKRFAAGNALTRVHMSARPHIIQALSECGISKILVLIRDPRDAIVSWSRHVDRNLSVRGLTGAIIDVEAELPRNFADFDERSRLRWQIENTLPRFCDWILGWVEMAETSTSTISFLDFAKLPGNERQFICNVLDFFEVKFNAEWIVAPSPELGKHNIASLDPPSLDAELLALANSKVPEKLLQYFGWKR